MRDRASRSTDGNGLLEPYEGQLSRTVLRGGGGGDAAPLSDHRAAACRSARPSRDVAARTQQPALLDAANQLRVRLLRGACHDCPLESRRWFSPGLLFEA